MLACRDSGRALLSVSTVRRARELCCVDNVAMECFHIDESGYTGFDLLNPAQRFQGAAAVSITEERQAA